MRKFISWRRVSTKRQGKSGLGLEDQLYMVQGWAKEEGGEIIADYVEVYTGTDLSGCRELRKAIAHCKEVDATLIIAKTDRFRNDAEAIAIFNEMGKNIYFCDCPTQDEFQIKMMFILAAREAKQISMRTRAALKAKRERDGDWSKEWGKYTGTTREQACRAANEASCKNKIEKAKNNENNIKFRDFVETLTKAYGKPKNRMEVQKFVNELNFNKIKTASGLPYTVERYRATEQKIKRYYTA